MSSELRRDIITTVADSSLTDAFAREVGEVVSWGVDLEQQLAALVDRALAAHPDLVTSPAELVASVGRAVREQPAAQALCGFDIADFALARACADGNPRALTQFERTYGREIDYALTRVPDVGMDGDDFRQKVREKLFTAEPGGEPRIAAYHGKGSLRAWVRVTALRLAIDLRRRRADPQHRVLADAELVERIEEAGIDPELAAMRSQWGKELRELLSQALAKLSPRHRNLLRHHYLHGVAGARLARMYNVHRATAFGWLDDARRSLRAHVAAAAQEQLRVGANEVHSLVALLGSRLDLSLRRLLDSNIEHEE